MSKDIKQHLEIKKKIRMNSEDKLLAKKIEQANAAKYTKTDRNNYVRLGTDYSGTERIIQNPLSKNGLQMINSNASGYSNNKESDQSHDKFGHFVNSKKKSVKSAKRLGSPTAELENKNDEEDTYLERDHNVMMPNQNLRLGSGNRNEPLHHYPFPLTPLDKASNKPVDFDDNLAMMKSQSTRNK
jgi:hypothetical protein